MRSMEDGGVDSTVIDCRQNQLDQMADFTTLLISLVLTYKSMMYLRLTAALPARRVRPGKDGPPLRRAAAAAAFYFAKSR